MSCGTRIAYVKGCRCEPCREANRLYARDRYRRLHRPDGEGPVYVDNTEAADHLAWLSTVGVGLRRVSELTGVSRSVLARIRSRDIARSRRETIDRILAVGRSSARPRSYVPAGPTWARIDDLLAHGWTKTAIGRAVTANPNTVSLQISRAKVTARTERIVAELHAEAMRPVLRDRELAAERRARYRQIERSAA